MKGLKMVTAERKTELAMFATTQDNAAAQYIFPILFRDTRRPELQTLFSRN